MAKKILLLPYVVARGICLGIRATYRPVKRAWVIIATAMDGPLIDIRR